jgi:hypothetical protein
MRFALLVWEKFFNIYYAPPGFWGWWVDWGWLTGE